MLYNCSTGRRVKEPNPVLEKLHHGTYRKTSAIASCTIALLSEGKATGQAEQSAKVQCATANTDER